jgi:Methyltransferase domain.
LYAGGSQELKAMPVGTTNTRNLDRDDARQLRPGEDHYLAYVGPPGQYDYMGATQFRLLTTLGLRESHRVLDLGCGSLRAGRLLIPYLLPDCYHGIEPNTWLVDEAIEHQLGRDILRIKRPRFDANSGFRADVFGVHFDFIVAQSVFSHATPELIATALKNMRGSLAPGGLIACTFVEAPLGDSADFAEGWVYPGCVRYTAAEVASLFARAELSALRIPWFHPRQTWYLGALDAAQLPADDELRELGGAVLRDPEFKKSIVR